MLPCESGAGACINETAASADAGGCKPSASPWHSSQAPAPQLTDRTKQRHGNRPDGNGFADRISGRKSTRNHPIESETCAWYIYERDALARARQAHVSQPTKPTETTVPTYCLNQRKGATNQPSSIVENSYLRQRPRRRNSGGTRGQSELARVFAAAVSFSIISKTAIVFYSRCFLFALKAVYLCLYAVCCRSAITFSSSHSTFVYRVF